jgi:hypothetical protein
LIRLARILPFGAESGGSFLGSAFLSAGRRRSSSLAIRDRNSLARRTRSGPKRRAGAPGRQVSSPASAGGRLPAYARVRRC